MDARRPGAGSDVDLHDGDYAVGSLAKGKPSLAPGELPW